MSTEVICRVVPGGLMAVDRAQADLLDGLAGREVKVKITQPRNLDFHRKYFAMIKAAFDMLDEYGLTFEQFRHFVTVGVGHCSFVPRGEQLIAVPKSISFGCMDQTQFERLYEDTLSFLLDQLDQGDADRRRDYRELLEFSSAH